MMVTFLLWQSTHITKPIQLHYNDLFKIIQTLLLLPTTLYIKLQMSQHTSWAEPDGWPRNAFRSSFYRATWRILIYMYIHGKSWRPLVKCHLRPNKKVIWVGLNDSQKTIQYMQVINECSNICKAPQHFKITPNISNPPIFSNPLPHD